MMLGQTDQYQPLVNLAQAYLSQFGYDYTAIPRTKMIQLGVAIKGGDPKSVDARLKMAGIVLSTTATPGATVPGSQTILPSSISSLIPSSNTWLFLAGGGILLFLLLRKRRPHDIIRES